MSEFQETMGRLADTIRTNNEIESYRKESSKKAFENGRKQGQIEELKWMYNYTQTTSDGGRKHLMRKIKERLIELEGVQ